MTCYQEFCAINDTFKITVTSCNKGNIGFIYKGEQGFCDINSFMTAVKGNNLYITNPSALEKVFKGNPRFINSNRTRMLEISKVYAYKHGKMVEFSHYSERIRFPRVATCCENMEEFIYEIHICTKMYIVNPSKLKKYLDKFDSYESLLLFIKQHEPLIKQRWQKIGYDGKRI